MLILLGAQGVGKSRFFAALSPQPSWFTDSIILKFGRDTAHRDEEMKLQGHWIIEVPELAGIWKSDFNDLKNFLTLQNPEVRKPYSPDIENLPRRALFGGSTNFDSVIDDSSGSRRFAFINVGKEKINVDWVKENRDQIWAQAKYWYEAGEQWWFNEEEFEQQTVDNRNYERVHPWHPLIEAWVNGKSRFSATDVLVYGVKKDQAGLKQADLHAVNTVLSKLGFERKQFSVKGTRPRGYANPDDVIDNLFTGRMWSEEDEAEF